jgi:hypothetical protein
MENINIRNDKRRSCRSLAGFCAMVKIDVGENETHYRPAKVRDISTNGFRLSLSDHVELREDTNILGVIVDLPDGPGFFQCRIRRMSALDGELEVGVAMAESDAASRQALYAFLTGGHPAKAA